jgi:hypothetical protein
MLIMYTRAIEINPGVKEWVNRWMGRKRERKKTERRGGGTIVNLTKILNYHVLNFRNETAITLICFSFKTLQGNCVVSIPCSLSLSSKKEGGKEAYFSLFSLHYFSSDFLPRAFFLYPLPSQSFGITWL